jgi:hypothetical protein
MKVYITIILTFFYCSCSNNEIKENTTASFIYITSCDSIYYNKNGKANFSGITGSKNGDSVFINAIIKEFTGSRNVILIKVFGSKCNLTAEIATNFNELFKSKKISSAILMPDSLEEKYFNDVSLEKFIENIRAENGGVMRMNIPRDEEIDTLKINAAAAMTLLPTGNNRLFYYQGEYKNIMTETDYKEIRKVITAFRQKTNSKDLMFLIKSDSAASFKNIIDLLDEMPICKVPARHYAEVPISESEKNYIKLKKENK